MTSKHLRRIENLKKVGRKSLLSKRVAVGLSTCGRAAGADKTFENLKDAGLNPIEVGCIGLCSSEPLVYISENGIATLYGNVKCDKDLKSIIGKFSLFEFSPYFEKPTKSEIDDPKLSDHPFYKIQKRLALRNCGIVNPLSLEEYIAMGGYTSLIKTLKMHDYEIIDEVIKSGLRGRGGAGFPTGLKWKIAKSKKLNEDIYVICNADEGDPGAYMDRAILEGDPFSVIEGMTIGAYALGARYGFVYIRNEYPLALKTVTKAIEIAKNYNLLGEGILGSDFSFDIFVVRGAGAFVCGEETALIASIEGYPCEPRPRPPYPAEKGLWGKPTVINNVETWANVPVIIAKGWKFFASIGTEKSKGTKVFSLTGCVKNTGLIEVPMGTKISEIIKAGGVEKLKAVYIGGPTGGCLPSNKLDVPIDYESLVDYGAVMGSGGMIAIDEKTCIIDMTKFFLDFLRKESCGKCLPCRVGLEKMYKIIEKIVNGKGKYEDIKELLELSEVVKEASLCGLGKTAPNTLLTALRYFRGEFEEHIRGCCPAGVCKELVQYKIDTELCNGCGRCYTTCVSKAVEIVESENLKYLSDAKKKRKIYYINLEKCIKCGICIFVCNAGAIKTVCIKGSK